ncbi:unnamed protein product [Bursaphelenchus xylophilus]|uniref:(pine wood nematode) hypothetical protein n=1 Tax=Bursaphelenchus xylophilus TaxID=6326 RepID=A0A7I8WSX8_BURXY|nr:unnamed protein product [Bursaphelenchus xylophilus]CAG9115565.1 unnamed protein product [Bursaphelenchus xylophilus]
MQELMELMGEDGEDEELNRLLGEIEQEGELERVLEYEEELDEEDARNFGVVKVRTLGKEQDSLPPVVNLFPGGEDRRRAVRGNRAVTSVVKPSRKVPSTMLVPLEDLGEGDDLNSWYLPMSALVHVFSYLSRDDLDRCEMVNKTWRSIVQHHPSRMRKRKFNVLELSTNKEFSIAFYYKQYRRRVVVKKYFKTFDIDSVAQEQLEKFRWPKRNVTADVVPYTRVCTQRSPLIYDRYQNYSKKLFTPPLEYYDLLKHYLRNGEVRDLILRNFSLTEFFVEQWLNYFGEYMKVDTLILHNVSLKHISSTTFHRFCGTVIVARHYHLEHLRNALPQHVSKDLVMTPGIVHCDSLVIGSIKGRHPRRLLPLDNFVSHLNGEALLEMAKWRIKNKVGSGISLKTSCGIREAQAIVMEYKLLYTQCTFEERASLFKLFHIEDASFTTPDIAEMD